jgi:hypothetical protein
MTLRVLCGAVVGGLFMVWLTLVLMPDVLGSV